MKCQKKEKIFSSMNHHRYTTCFKKKSVKRCAFEMGLGHTPKASMDVPQILAHGLSRAPAADCTHFSKDLTSDDVMGPELS